VIKSTLWIACKYLLAFAVLFYVVYANWEPSSGRGLGEVWQRHVIERQPINGIYLLSALVLHLFSMLSTLLRWYLLVRAQDLPLTLFGAIRIGALGFLFNAFLPGAVGGDFIKAAALARGQSRQTVAVATVIMDRALSLWGLIFLVAVVGSLCWSFGVLEGTALGPSRVVIAASAITIGLTGVLWLALGWYPPRSSEQLASKLGRVPRIGGSLSQLWQAIWLYRYRPASVAWAIVLSTFSNVCDVLAFYGYVVALWDGLPANPLPSLTDHFLLVPVGLVISAVPLFPGGAGIGEAGFGGLYALFDSAPANGILGSLLFRVCGWLIGVFGYLLCAAFDTTRKERDRNNFLN
jgi:uncharacterized membrane protein YbhN (UPF0104 family)